MIPDLSGCILRPLLVTICVLLCVCWPVEGTVKSDCIAPIQYYDKEVARCSPCPALCRGAPEECKEKDRCTDFLVFNETFGYVFSELDGLNDTISKIESRLGSKVEANHGLLVALLVVCLAIAIFLVLLIIVIAIVGCRSGNTQTGCLGLNQCNPPSSCCPDKNRRNSTDPLPLRPHEESLSLVEHQHTTMELHEEASQPRSLQRRQSQESATQTKRMSRLPSVSEDNERSEETGKASASSKAAAAIEEAPKLDKPESAEGKFRTDPGSTGKPEPSQVKAAVPQSAPPPSTHSDIKDSIKETETQDGSSMRQLALVLTSGEDTRSRDSQQGQLPSAPLKSAEEKEAVDTQPGTGTQSSRPSTRSHTSPPTTLGATSDQPPGASGERSGSASQQQERPRQAVASIKPEAKVKPTVSNPSSSKAEGDLKSDADKPQASGASQGGAAALPQEPPEIDTQGSGLVGQPQSDAEGTDEDDGGNNQPALVLLLPGGERQAVRGGRITSETERISEPIGRQTPTAQLGRYRDDPISTMPSDPGGGTTSLYSRSGYPGLRSPERMGATGDRRGRPMPSIPTEMTDQLKGFPYVNLIAVDQEDVLRINVDPPKFTQACRELPRVIRQYWKVPKRFKIEAKDQE